MPVTVTVYMPATVGLDQDISRVAEVNVINDVLCPASAVKVAE